MVTDLTSQSKSDEDEVKGLANTLTDVERKMEQNIQELDIRLKVIDSCQNLCVSLVTICNEQKKLLTSLNCKRLMKSMADAKKKFRERLARVKLLRRIVSRTVVACPPPWMMRAKRYLQNRVKTLDLSTSLPADVERTSLPQIKDFNNLVRRIRSELRQQEQRQKKPEEPKFTFHTNRGYNVNLEMNGQSAECQSTDGCRGIQ
ncbi:uncharacterized protein LOC112576360 [Pomacea canaliculata]|uniref:uncharacterized protein LOC112576360 n=1 Tax=Pomacea canaliculata TaxID=400727 RepID=UPI000D72F95A|nr:uncharacterized protein LOC112576360 [Pomacea canaliculata]